MVWRICILLILRNLTLQGQNQRVFIYDFNSCFLQEKNNNAGAVSNLNPALCDCGLEGDAIRCSGQALTWPLSYDTIYKNNWSLGFAVRLNNLSGIIDLFSKQSSCNADTTFSVVFRTIDSTLSVTFRQGFDKQITMNAKLKLRSCWQQIFITKNLGNFRIYENGDLIAEENSNLLIQLHNKQSLRFNGSNCTFQNFSPYSGLLDFVVLADHAIASNEILKYYSPQQDIITQDTLIFLGESLDLISLSNCPVSVQWTPSSTLSSPNSLLTEATPVVTTNYIARFNDRGCVIIDSVLVRVVDKEKLECANLQLPTAFTPNNDNLNETFGISNYYLISKLNFFDILDRNGGVIASFKNSDDTWDGTWNGKKLNPGTFFYKVSYNCKNQDYFKSGSFYMLK